MRSHAFLSVSVAFAFCAFLCPGISRAQGTQNAQSFQNKIDSTAAKKVAAQMVPAVAVLKKDLDSRKMRPGEQFHALLSETVHLKNGSELPRGTALVGTIATDNMEAAGRSTLALRFTKAELKDGKVIPIKATIVGVAAPANLTDDSDNGAMAYLWNGKELGVDQIGALSGVDLHSRIAGENSGVFVSTKKDDMKLDARSQLALAITARNAG